MLKGSHSLEMLVRIFFYGENHTRTHSKIYNQEPNEQNKTGAVLDFEICGQQEEYVVFEREARELQQYLFFTFLSLKSQEFQQFLFFTFLSLKSQEYHSYHLLIPRKKINARMRTRL